MGLVSASVFVPNVNLEFPKLTPGTHFIGLGGGGSNVIEHIFKKGINSKYTCISSPIRLHLPDGINYISKKSPVKQICYYKGEEVYRETDWTMHFDLVDKNIKSLFNENDHYIIFTCLGGYLGTNLSVQLAHYLKESNIDFSVIASLPFQFEGELRMERALTAKRNLEKFDNFFYYENENIRKNHGNMKIADAFDLANEYSYSLYESSI